MTNESPKIISLRDQTIPDLSIMAKTFNKFFCLVAQEVQLKVPFSYKTFFEYLPPHNVHTAPFCRQGLNLLPNFQKGGALTGPQLLDGVVRKDFSEEGLPILHKK